MNRLGILILAFLVISFANVQAQCPTEAATTISSINETCPGASDGSILLEFSDATTPFTYFVFNLTTGIVFPTITETLTSVEFSGLPAGNYSISVIHIPPPAPICVTTFNNGNIGIAIGSDPFATVLPGQTETICSGDNAAYEILLDPLNDPPGSLLNWPQPIMSDGSIQGTAGNNIPADPAGTIHINDVLVNTTGGPITATYTVTPVFGVCAGTPTDVIITVDPAPVIVPGQSKSICGGANVDYEILMQPLNMPTGTLFNWPVPVMSDGSSQGTAGTDVAADPAGTIHITDVLINTSTANITATYTITPSQNCDGAPVDVVITIAPAPVLQPNQQKTICSGDAVNVEILLNPLNIPAGSILNWPVPIMSDGSLQGTAGVNVAADPAGTMHITDVLVNITGADITATYTVVANLGACAGTPEDIIITVAPEPVIVPGQGTTVCSGDFLNYEIILNPANSPAGVLFNWPLPVMSDGSVQGSVGANVPADPSGSIQINDSLVNITGATITATYSITPANGTCVGQIETIVFTMEPQPVVQSGQTKTICTGDPVNMEILLSPLNAPAGSLLNWPVPVLSDGSVQGSAGVNVAADPAGTIHLNDVLVNSTTAPITATYTVTSNNGLCFGLPEDIVITINPAPVIEPGQTKVICSGDATNLEILLNPPNTPAGSIYNWPAPVISDGSIQGSAGVNVAADPAGTIHIFDVLVNATAGPITATYTVTASSSNNCLGTTEDIVITIVPNPTDVGIVEAPAQSICEGLDQTITLVTSDLDVDYEVLIDGAASGLPVVTGDGSANLLIGTLTGMASGNYTISVTATVGTCSITLSDNILFSVDITPSSTITGPVAICENTSSNYSAPTGATTYFWALVGGGSISAGQGTETITVDWLTAGGDLTLTATGPAPANCFSDTTITIGVFGMLPPLPDETLDACQNASIPTLTTTPVPGSTVNWYVGTVDPTNLKGTGDSFTPDPADLDMSVVGTTYFLFTQNLGCGESIPANYAVNVVVEPDAGSNGATSVCITAPILDLYAIITGTPDIGGSWTDDDNSGAMSPTGLFDPGVAGDGIYRFTYQVDGVGACAGLSPTALVTVGVSSTSDLPIPEQPFYTGCTFGTAPTLTVTGINVLWYSDAGLTDEVGSGLAYTPNSSDLDMSIQGTTPFYATQDQGCGESSGIQINVVLEGVNAEIGEVEETYPEQKVGSIEVIRIVSNNPPMEILLLDGNGGIVQDWSPVNDSVGDEYHYFFDQLGAGLYEVIIQDAAGCEISLSVPLANNTDVFIPNVFTPNNDSYNDIFKILNKTANTKIEINNRWGVSVFSSDDYQNDWQAEGLVDGVYFYTVSMDGAIYKGHVEVWRGK